VSADVGDAPGAEAKAAADPPVAAEAAAEGFDPPPAHAVRPAPPMTAATITAGTRHILMFLPPMSNHALQKVTFMVQM